jgi:proline dehydrogenase
VPALSPLRRRRRGPSARFVAGPHVEDAVRVAGELVAAGRRVALDHLPGRGDDAGRELSGLAGRIAAAGLAGRCELDLPADRLATGDLRRVAAAAADVGLAVCLHGPAGLVDPLAVEFPAARVAVPARDPDAASRCTRHRDRAVRLLDGRGSDADLCFVRCLNVLFGGHGSVAAATADERLIAVAGERAAWYDRPHESWEHVMPYGRRTDEQRRLVAAGAAVRVAVPSGAGAAAALARRFVAGGTR